MERDFMGVHFPKSSPFLTVKQVLNYDASDYSVTMKGSGLQWSFSNSVSASPQILSFISAQDQGRNSPMDKRGGNTFPITGHHWQHTTNQTNQTVPASISSVLPPHRTSNGTRGASSVSPSSISSPNSPVVGSTDLRSSSSVSAGPCQLTIFYNGSVCVYDNVSPEKAQAIMLLAGNGDSTNSSTPVSGICSNPKMQSTGPKPSANDASVSNQSIGFSRSLGFAQPISLSSVASTGVAEVTPVKQVAPAPVKCTEPPKSAAVPQARKASLARFLEKRKERVIGASPYVVSKNSSQCSAPGLSGSMFARNSATPSSFPASN